MRSSARCARPARALRTIALVVGCALVFTLLSAPSAFAIARDSVLARAQGWVDRPVPYSQSRYHAGYRTDCSGYVSMCWSTGTSWATSSFHAVTHKIAVAQLKPGDALLKKGYHIRLFYGWVDPAHTSYLAYEAGSMVAISRVHSISGDVAAGYVPTRYNRISDSPQSANALHNGSFDVWATSWGGGEQPMWWQVDGPPWQSVVAHRKDAYHSARNALELANPSDNPASDTQISQVGPVTPGAIYRLSAWARTASDPRAVTLSVAYLDASGTSLAETSTAGDAWGLNGSAFRQMSAMTTAPAGAVSALVTVRLAGGTTPGATGDVAGTSVLLDDVALARPQAVSSIKPSAASSRIGRRISLSGSVSPTSAVGQAVVVYVQRPGLGWRRLAVSSVTSPGDSATWGCGYSFKRGMRKGVYHFRVAVPAFGGYLGSTSGTASVRVR